MDYPGDRYRERKGVTETYRWMGWLYTVVVCFIVALLVLMFLDMSNHSKVFQQNEFESAPAMQLSQPAISNYSSPTEE
ncbi:MAG: hypothetical protein J1F12_08730 [Muribaculaceae bacterium]|nr:hypothetical protein [Muribaculaceae bacterium]